MHVAPEPDGIRFSSVDTRAKARDVAREVLGLRELGRRKLSHTPDATNPK
jgi:hypothetical protein